LYTGKFNIELISPASERQIARAMPSPGRSLTIETSEIYEKVTKPYIQDIVNSGSLSWVQNIISGKKEKERLLFENDEWILNIDTKWRSHPDPLTIPRTEWQKKNIGHRRFVLFGNFQAQRRNINSRFTSQASSNAAVHV